MSSCICAPELQNNLLGHLCKQGDPHIKAREDCEKAIYETKFSSSSLNEMVEGFIQEYIMRIGS